MAAVEGWIARQRGLEGLGEALSLPSPPSSTEAAAELGAVVGRIYDLIADNRFVLKLFESCAEELPALAQRYLVERHRGLFAVLGEFLDARISAGVLGPVPDVPTAARFIAESIAWFALHRLGDPDSAMLSDEDPRRTVVALVPASFLPCGARKCEFGCWRSRSSGLIPWLR